MISDYMVDYQWCDEARPVEKTNMLKRLRNVSRASYNWTVKWAMDNGIAMPVYFAYPWKFFWADGAYLKCLGSGLKLKCDPPMNWDTETQGMIDQYYPQRWCDLTPCETLRMIFDYLKTIDLTPYYKALLRFKWETGLLEFPMFDQKNMIEVIDGKLAGFVCSQGTKGREKRLLTDEAVTAEIKQCGGNECKDNDIKRKLASGLLKLHEQENTPENSTEKFEAMFDWGNVSYLPIVGQLNIKYGKEGWPWYTPPQKPVLSEDGRESLRILSSGELSHLDDIAELVARLYMPELPSEYMWVVCGEKTGIHQFCQWILTLTNGRWGNAVYIKDEEERNKQLAEDQVLGCPCQINDSFISVDKFKKINHSMLQKFVAGEVVGTLKDPYQEEQNIFGKSVLICAAETIDGIDFGKLKYKIVQIPKGWTCWALQENRNNIWVQSCLLCHGLHVMEGRETKEQSAQMTLDEVIRRFVREFCGVKAGSWINRKSFCEYLCRYNDKCLHGKKIEMGTTQLGQYVENLLCWESEEIRRDKNRRGFKDWHMNIERIDAEIQRAEECERQAEEPKNDNFEQYIDALSELLAEPNVAWR